MNERGQVLNSRQRAYPEVLIPGLSGGSIRLIINYYFKIIARIAASGSSKYAGSIGLAAASGFLPGRSVSGSMLSHKLTGYVAVKPCYKFPLLSP
jgi:uncharacterized membrane protein